MTLTPEQQAVFQAAAQETGRRLGFFMARITVGLLIVSGHGVLSLIRGVGGTESIISVVGPIVCAGSLVLYPMSMYRGRSVSGFLLATTGWLPLLLAVYVVLVMGIGRLFALTSTFS